MQPKKPPIRWLAYFRHSRLECLVCGGRPMGRLSRHLRKLHGMSVPEYQNRFEIPYYAALLPLAQQERKAARVRERQRRQNTDPVDWELLLERLAAGESLASLDGAAWMPTRGQITVRRNADPAFRARYDTAIETAGPRSGHTTPGRIWALVLDYLRVGLTDREVGLIPGMPHRRTILKKRRRDPAFNAEVEAILGPAGHRAPRSWGKARRRRGSMAEREARFLAHVMSGMSVKAASRQPDAICRRTVDRRKEDSQFRAKLAAALQRVTHWRRAYMNREARLFDFVAAGLPLWEATERSDTPSAATVWAKRRNDAVFRERLEKAMATGATARETGSVADPISAPRIATTPRAATRMSATEMIRQVTAAIPKGLPIQVREEVSQDMVLAVLSGRFAAEDAKAHVRAFVQRAYADDPGALGRVSFDAMAEKGFEPGSSPGYGERRHAPSA